MTDELDQLAEAFGDETLDIAGVVRKATGNIVRPSPQADVPPAPPRPMEPRRIEPLRETSDPDSDEFVRLMALGGVVALGDRRNVSQRRTAESSRAQTTEQQAQAEFEAAMAALDRVVDKDAPPPQVPVVDDPRVRHLKYGPRDTIRVDGRLDLHGMRQREAERELDRFVVSAWLQRHRLLVVVTGKGHHSSGGVAVLKPAVESWLAGEGQRYVAAFGDAPKAHGGRGALVVQLREHR